MNDESLIALASRNAMILKWLRELDENRDGMNPIRARRTARDYAEAFSMPLHEVEHCLSYLTDPASLDFMWANYRSDIKAADFLRA